jgi:hypothetical protein
MTVLRWLTSDTIMDATAPPHREVHHGAPEPGGYDPIHPKWLADFRFDAHSGLTSYIA